MSYCFFVDDAGNMVSSTEMFYIFSTHLHQESMSAMADSHNVSSILDGSRMSQVYTVNAMEHSPLSLVYGSNSIGRATLIHPIVSSVRLLVSAANQNG
jgi:hypothetical protein